MIKQLSKLIQQQSNPCIFINPKGIVEIINKPALNILGLSIENCLGKYFHEVTSDSSLFFDEKAEVDIHQEICPVYDVIINQKSMYKDDDVFWNQDGSVLNVEYYVDPYYDDEIFLGGLINFHEISARLYDLNKLLDEEERRRLIIENSITAIISIDSDGQVIDWNNKAEDIFGWSRAEAIEKPLEEMIIPNRYIKRHNGGLANFFHTGELKSKGQFIEIEALRKDGSEVSIEMSLFPFVTRFGQHIISATCQDITERKMFVEELVKANEKSLAASRSKSDFLSNMSHEIRTPLTSIIGFAEALQNNTMMEQEIRQDSINTIVHNGKHLLGLINDILDYSKIEAGKLTLEKIDVDLPELIKNVVTMISPQMDAKGLEFIAEIITPCPKWVRTDPTRLRQVLLNLLGNAIKFTEEGFIRLTITFDRQNSELIFSLLDTGIGINDEAQKNLFQSFNQEDNSVSRKYGGTGLGLSISKRLCSLLGGDLRLQSSKGAGSLFYFNIKVDKEKLSEDFDQQRISRIWLNDPDFVYDEEDNLATTDQNTTEQKSIYPGSTILLAEDNPSNQKLISMHLNNMKVDYEIVENGQLALEAAMLTDYDLILMDMQMPVMGGVEATEMLRMTGYDGAIVALTANVMAQDREKFEEAGCDAFLPKPLDLDKMYAVMDQFLSDSKKEADLSSQVSLEDSPEFKALVEEFEASVPMTLQKMQTLLNENDYTEIQSLAHQLKGAGTSFGYKPLSELGAEIEIQAKEKDAPELEKLLEILTAKVNALL